MTKKVSRNEMWRRQYREDRYCRHLDQTELNRRLRDLLLNLLRLTKDGKIGIIPMDPSGHRITALFTHALEEMQIRHGPFPNGFTSGILHAEPPPDFASELGRKGATALATAGLSPDSCLIKFGQSEYMTALFKKGNLRLQPASYYSNHDHNSAIRDDELSMAYSVNLSFEDLKKIVVNGQNLPADFPDQRFDFEYHSKQDYWIYCLTNAIEPRLFVDFHADACVIIHNREEFAKRMQAAEVFPCSAFGAHRHGQVKYVDPLRELSATHDIPMLKHFRHAYQSEYRFIWEPDDHSTQLEHVDLTLGPLQDIANLVTL